VRPVLFTILGFPIQSYGVSKALAALAAWWLLQRSFRRLGWNPEHAGTIVLVATLAGFAGAKVYYLLEHAGDLSLHDFGSMGFTWYGGLIGGVLGVILTARRYRLPLSQLAGVVAAPLSLAYGIGRLGCLLSGDGTYGKPTNLPWGMTFPDGVVPTTVPVHPTPLYEALVAFALAGLLWWLQSRWQPLRVFALYLALSGLARLLIEALRTNTPALFGLTQPQLWSIVLILAAGVLAWYTRGPAADHPVEASA
jgi:phosphatidylglycerol:prolipoprotein diacylglycerol transferase